MLNVAVILLVLPAARSDATSFGAIAYDCFRGMPPHPAAPMLATCIAAAGAHPEGLVTLEGPEASRTWLHRTLLGLGFEEVAGDVDDMEVDPCLTASLA